MAASAPAPAPTPVSKGKLYGIRVENRTLVLFLMAQSAHVGKKLAAHVSEVHQLPGLTPDEVFRALSTAVPASAHAVRHDTIVGAVTRSLSLAVSNGTPELLVPFLMRVPLPDWQGLAVFRDAKDDGTWWVGLHFPDGLSLAADRRRWVDGALLRYTVFASEVPRLVALQ